MSAIFCKLLVKYVTIIYYAHEKIHNWIKAVPKPNFFAELGRTEQLNRSKFKWPFINDSDAKLFMALYVFNVLCSAHEIYGAWTGPDFHFKFFKDHAATSP